MAFAQMLGAQAWSHTIMINNEPKRVYIDGREYSTNKISKRVASSIDVFKFKKLFFPFLKNSHFNCMVLVHVNERRIGFYDSMVSDKQEYVHYLVKMFHFLVDKHAARKGSLLPGDWTLQFVHPDISPQQFDYSSRANNKFYCWLAITLLIRIIDHS